MHVVIPRTVVLDLPGGISITVREQLNHGEHVAMLARMYRQDGEGIDPLKTGDAMVLAYLVDWNLTGADERRIEIRDLAPERVAHVLNNLQRWVFAEIKQAIEVHDAARREADEQLKKTASIEAPSPAMSLSAV